MECLYDRRALYPVSHVFLPFAVQLFTARAWVTFSIVVVWELIEYALFETWSSYVIFPGDAESLCDVVLLDLGNGVLGLLLAKWFMRNGYERPRQVWYWTLLAVVLWSLFSPWGFDCVEWMVTDCAGWGVPALSALLLVYSFTVTAPWFLVVGWVYLNVTWIPVSVPLLVYCTTVVLFAWAWVTRG